jgi:hypothetical protein
LSDIEPAGFRLSLWPATKVVLARGINFGGAIASIAAFLLILADGWIGPIGTAVVGVICVLGIAAYLAVAGRRIIETTANRLIAQTGEEQRSTIDVIQQNFSKELASKSEEIAAHESELKATREAIQNMAGLSLDLRRIEYNAALKDQPKSAVRELLRNTLVELAAVFGKVSGVPCRVCIKMVYDHVGDSGTQRAVRALARSNTSLMDRRDQPDLVDKNTDFSAILINRQKFWFSGNIHEDRGYSTTSNTLPYSSVITWPLRIYDTSAPAQPPADKLGNIIGFLCLDSEQAHAFEEDREVRIGWWFVDTLAGTMDELIKKSLIDV